MNSHSKPLAWLAHNIEEVICCSCLVIISVCVMLQVVMRYAFQTALPWTEEVSAIAMVWAVYSGAVLCVRERFHIRIIIAVTSLPRLMGKICILLADFAWVIFCVFMIKVGIEYLAVLWKYPSHTPSLGINEFYPQTILVIGYALMLVRLVQLYTDWFRTGAVGLPGLRAEDLDDTFNPESSR